MGPTKKPKNKTKTQSERANRYIELFEYLGDNFFVDDIINIDGTKIPIDYVRLISSRFSIVFTQVIKSYFENNYLIVEILLRESKRHTIRHERFNSLTT